MSDGGYNEIKIRITADDNSADATFDKTKAKGTALGKTKVTIPVTASNPIDDAWRARINAAIKATAKDALAIPVEADTARLREDTAEALASLKSFAREEIPVQLADADRFKASVEALLEETRAEVSLAAPVEMPVRAENPIDTAWRAQVAAAVRALSKDTLKLPVTPDTQDLAAKLAPSLAELRDLAKIPVDMEPEDASALRAAVDARIAEARARVEAARPIEIPVQVDVDQSAGGQVLKNSESRFKAEGSVMGGLLATGIGLSGPLVGAAITGAVATGFAGAAVAAQKGNQDIIAHAINLKNQLGVTLRDASAQVVPEIIGAEHQLQQEIANLGPDLKTAFSYAAPDIQALVDGVKAFANNAMPGAVAAAKNSQPVMAGLATVMGSTGTAFTTLADTAASHSDEIGRDLKQVGGIIENVATDAAGVLPGLINGFGGAAGSVNTMLTALKPAAPLLGTIAGKVLPVVGDMKLLGAVGQPIDNLGSKLQSTAEKMTMVGGATGKVGTAVGVAGKALSGFGASLPLVGAAVGVVSDAIAASDQKFQVWQQDLLKGGDLAKTAMQQYSQQAGFLPGQFDKLFAGLSDQQKALAIYNGAVAEFGPNSRQAAEAQKALAGATEKAAADQERQNRAMETAAQLESDRVAGILGQANAMLGLQSAQNSLADAEATYQSAVKQSGKTSQAAKDAYVAEQQAIMQVIQAAGAKAAADDKNGTDAQKAVDTTNGEVAAVRQLVAQYAVAGKQVPDALAGIASQLTHTSAQALVTAAQFDNVRSAMAKVPPGKSITVQALTADAQRELEAMGYQIKHLPNGTFRIIPPKDTVTPTIDKIVARNNGRKITMYINQVTGAFNPGGSSGHVHGNAGGGPVTGAAVMNEYGPEAVKLPNGSLVLPHANTAGLMRDLNSSGGGPSRVEMAITGDSTGPVAAMLRNLIRTGVIRLQANGQPVVVA